MLLECRECGTPIGPDNRVLAYRTCYKAYYKHRCKACEKKHTKARALLWKGEVLQGVRCEICGDLGRCCLDHDHTTLEKRGWLCQRCNSGLGFFQESPQVLEKALLYLNVFLARDLRAGGFTGRSDSSPVSSESWSTSDSEGRGQVPVRTSRATAVPDRAARPVPGQSASDQSE